MLNAYPSQPGTMWVSPSATAPDLAHSCRTCAHFGWLTISAAVWCEVGPVPQLNTHPSAGCARWMREPGADDPAEVA